MTKQQYSIITICLLAVLLTPCTPGVAGDRLMLVNEGAAGVASRSATSRYVKFRIKDGRETIHFEIPPMPVSFDNGGESNQSPPDWLLVPSLVPKTFIASADRPPLDEGLVRSQAQTEARLYLGQSGFSSDDAVITARINQDPYGGVHVKMHQYYKGLQVIGAGFIVHMEDAPEANFSDYLIRGVEVETTPRISEEDARSRALEAYGSEARLAPAVESRLAILPELERVHIGSRRDEPNAEDFEKILVGSHLVWEVTVFHAMPEIDDEVLVALVDAAAPVLESDEDLRDIRQQNKTVGGHAEAEAVHEAFTTALTQPPIRYRYDAVTGELLDEQLLIDQFDYTNEKGTGYGYYNGEVELNTVFNLDTNRYVLIDAARPDTADFKGNIVFDAKHQNTHDYQKMLMMTDGNNSWGSGDHFGTEDACYQCTARQTPAADVAWGMQVTWDALDNALGRNGPKGNGDAVHACVHYGEGYDDAHYNGNSDFLCFGDGATASNVGNYSLGTVAHELGHAFWKAEGITDGGSGTESDALNEGQGDIQAGFVKMYANTSNGTGSQIRRFINFANWRARVRNPESYDEEDEEGKLFIGQRYWSEDLVNMPEHVGGLPFARAVIHLAQGASSNPDANLYSLYFENGLGGIGVTRAAHIWNHAMSNYVFGDPVYGDIRNAFLDAAGSLYGVPSMEHKAVQNAFAAINVGGKATDARPPEFTYAKVFDVNTTDMTARILAVVDEDTGIRQVRVNNYGNNGYYKGDVFHGYASIARAKAGSREFEFEVEDSAGNKTSTIRSFVVPKNRNRVDNGDFEDGNSDWTSDSNINHVRSDERRAFIGSGYLAMSNVDRVYQDVDIPGNAKNVSLVFRLLTRNETTTDDFMSVDLYDTGDSFLKNLANFNVNTGKQGRSALNKGYIRHSFDLSEYAGQTIRVAFNNNTFSTPRYYIDQVVLTYESSVFIDAPAVSLREWENSVSFKLPVIHGIESSEIGLVQYYVDGEQVTLSDEPFRQWFGGAFLDELGGGPHWVGAVVRGHDNKILGISKVSWFMGKPFNELLVNGDFEDGPWDLVFSSPPPKVDIVKDVLDFSIAFDGQQALRMGSQAVAGAWLAGQLVKMPKTMKTLAFSTRVNMASAEFPDGNANNNDELYVEFWNNKTFALIERFKLTDSDEKISTLGLRDFYARYWREEIELLPGKYAGKDVVVRFVLEEDAGAQTTYYLDNVSLRYRDFGISGVPPQPPGPEI